MIWRKQRSATTAENNAYRTALGQWLMLCDLEYDYAKSIVDRDLVKSSRLADMLHLHRTNCIELSQILLNSHVEDNNPEM